MDVSLQVGPNGFYFFESQPSIYGKTEPTEAESAEEVPGAKCKAEDDNITFTKSTDKSEFLIKDASVQSTTGEVSIYEVSPSVEELQKLFAKKILPYYSTVEKKARKKVLKIIYDIKPPPALRSFKTQTSESDFPSQTILSEGMKLDMKDKSREFIASEDISPILQSISGRFVCKKGADAYKSISVQVDLSDSNKKKEKRKIRPIDSSDDESYETKPVVHEIESEQLRVDDKKVTKRYKDSEKDTCFQTKVLKDLRRFLLEKNVWDIVFWRRRVSKSEGEIFKGSRILISDERGEYLEEETYFTTHWVDRFIAEFAKISFTDIQDNLTHFSEEIRLRDVAMNLYWQTMAPKSHQKCLPDLNEFFTNLELEDLMDKSSPITKSSDIDKKLSSYEKMGIVRQHIEDIKKLLKRTGSMNNKGTISRKSLLKRLLGAIYVLQEKLWENFTRIVQHKNIKNLTVDSWNKAEELLDHERTIYKYSELDEIIPHLWIGDFSALNTPHMLRNIQYTILLGDCKKCITGQHDICTAKWRPFIYTPPFYFANKNIQYMGIQAIDDATFPIFEYFRAACDYIVKSLSASPEANVAVISKSGKSRCTAIVIAYLMIKKSYTLREAVQELKRKRAIRPNLGFMIQLIQLERKLRSKSKKPDINYKMKNAFAIRRKNFLESSWIGEEQSVTKPTKSFVFLDDRMSSPDRRLGVNTNLFLHSPFSAPGPHFYKDIENSVLKTSLFEMLPFYELDIATTNVEGSVLASFSC
ncbi:Dual specificity phosphatase DUPD1 like protein [Argiope bruennichi]|uniref:Dual specificity phosphatase DUPD1 like protein n=1 Tax=Argiope bruennichi TaxID=94029 RepID=A0A8T0E7C5_ARGBR|nr:Dual specificity phosphatase DUPD1 like protein [Argiope bruennichi]